MTKVTTRAALVLALSGCAGAPRPALAPAPARVPAEAVTPAVPVGSETPDTFPKLLKAIEAAYRQGDYVQGLSLVQKAFELKGSDVSSLDRIGSVYYALGRYGEALSIWQRALPLEKNRRRRRELEDSIIVARRLLGIPAEEPSGPAGPPPKPPARPQVKPPPDPKEIDGLYKSGVRYYAQGEYLQATSSFLRVLELDPDNADAKKALERLRLEPVSGQ